VDPRGDERAALRVLINHCPEIGVLAEHVRGFVEMMTGRRGERLDSGVAAASGGGLGPAGVVRARPADRP
jgi:hypothetical protein